MKNFSPECAVEDHLSFVEGNYATAVGTKRILWEKCTYKSKCMGQRRHQLISVINQRADFLRF